MKDTYTKPKLKDNEYPLLQISNIDWDEDYDGTNKLPNGFELRWAKKEWTKDEVSEWVSIKFDWVIKDIQINEVGTYEVGGCSCC